MSTGSKKKRRIDRVTSVELPPGVLGNLWGHLRRGHVLVRLALCTFTALLLWGITRGWAPPPPPYHWGDVPSRDIVARTEFKLEDLEATEKKKEEARSLAIATYDHDPANLEQRRAKVENEVTEILAAKSLDDVKDLWNAYRLPLAEGTPEPTPEENAHQFQRFRDALSAPGSLDSFKNALNLALEPVIEKGVLEKIGPEHTANVETISVRRVGSDAGFDRTGVPVRI